MNTCVSPRSRPRRISSTQSWTRPEYSSGRLAGDVERCAIVFQRERLERGGALEPRLDIIPVEEEIRRRGHTLLFADRFVVARRDLLPGLAPDRPDLVRLGYEERLTGHREIVEHVSAAVGFGRIAAGQLLKGSYRSLVELYARPLRRRIVAADGFDRVADELQADRLRRAGGVVVNHAAPNAELARFVDGILTRVAGRDEDVGERRRGNLLARRQDQRGLREAAWRAQPRQQRRRGRDHEPGRRSREPMKRARARRADVEVGLQPAVRIHFVRREGKDRALGVRVGQAFENRQKEARVNRHALDFRVVGHHEDDRRSRGSDGRRHRLCGRRQPRGAAGTTPIARHTHPEPAGGRLQDSAERERTGGVRRHGFRGPEFIILPAATAQLFFAEPKA